MDNQATDEDVELLARMLELMEGKPVAMVAKAVHAYLRSNNEVALEFGAVATRFLEPKMIAILGDCPCPMCTAQRTRASAERLRAN